MDLLPPLERLTQIFSNATAPAFFLGAVAVFVSLMTNRLAVVRERASKLDAIAGKRDPAVSRRSLQRLIRRARLLTDAILLTLCSGISSTLLLTLLFLAQFLGAHHAYGAAVLFVVATLFLSAALFFFFREAWLARYETDDEILVGLTNPALTADDG